MIASLGLRVKEKKEVYEGEVTEFNPVETENPLGGFGMYIIITTFLCSLSLCYLFLKSVREDYKNIIFL